MKFMFLHMNFLPKCYQNDASFHDRVERNVDYELHFFYCIPYQKYQ